MNQSSDFARPPHRGRGVRNSVPPESAAANVMVSLSALPAERQRLAQRRLAVVRVDGVVERRAGECVLKATLNLFENRTTI